MAGNSVYFSLKETESTAEERPVGPLQTLVFILVISLLICLFPLLLVVLLIALPFIKHKQKKARRQKLLPSTQKPHPQIPARKPGSNAPLLHGVRVVEISSFIAGPSVGRCLADLGAEVVKVEEPGGDLFRYTLLEYEQTPLPREFFTGFELQNMGKVGLQADFKTKEGKQFIFKLLQEADVLVTNIRPESLKKLGLDYDTIKYQFPSLVYGQVTAWGTTGEEQSNAGYDVGSFWAASGMAASVNNASSYSLYPAGFGDLATAQVLLAGIGLALQHRLLTGQGQYVTTALVQNGIWCTAPLSLLHSDAGPEIPDYSKELLPTRAVHHVYDTKDNKAVAISDLDHAEDSTQKLIQHFGITNTTTERGIVSQLQDKFMQMSVSELTSVLEAQGIPFSVFRGYREAVESSDDVTCQHAKCYDAPVPDLQDIVRTPRLPWDLSCSTEHGPRGRAPFKGEHNDSFIRRGWSPIVPQAKLPQVFEGRVVTRSLHAKPFSDITIVEFSETDTCVSGACCILSDLGARVVVVEPPGGMRLRTDHSPLFHQLNRGKHSVTVDWSTPEGVAALHKLVVSADALVTNRPAHLLKQLGLDYSSSSAWRDKVFCILSPKGTSGPSNVRGAMPTFYFHGGTAGFMGGTNPSDPPQFPEHYLELLCSSYVFSGVSLALFHKHRTGEGQLVEINYLRLGIWSSQIFGVMCAKDPSKYDALIVPPTIFGDSSPVATFNSFQTRDGMWVQLLGVDIARHLGPTLKSLGITLPTYSKVVWALATQVIPNKTTKSKIIRLRPVFWVLNRSIRKAVGSLTWHEVQQRFRKHDVWFSPVRMPRQVIGYKQAHDIGVFVRAPGPSHSLLITSPIRLTGSAFTREIVCQSPPPGHHNSMFL